RIQLRIAVRPEQASMKLIGSRSCGHLDLTRTAAGFRVGRGYDDTDFVHEIRTHVSRRSGPDVVPAIADGDAVACGVELRQSAPGKVASLSSGGSPNKVENVARRERKIADSIFGENHPD